MKKEIHKKSNPVTFICASCNSSFLIESTLDAKETTIDVCSSCHPFYIGTSVSQQVKGRAEKFNKKIVTNPTDSKSKSDKQANKKQKKVVHSLNSL